MPQRPLTLGLLWLAAALLLALFLLLWTLRGAAGAAIDAALVINALLLLSVAGLLAARRSAGKPAQPAPARPPAPSAATRLLAQVSREIRTPLNAVMGMTHLALQTPLSVEQRELLTQADTASRTLLALVDDALDIARIEAGQMEIEARPLRLEDIVARAIEQARPMHANAQVALVCDWADASLLGARGQLIGDPTRLQQLLVKLLANALRGTSSGQVWLRLAAHPSDAQGHVPLVITVQDSGGGMSTAQLDALFHDAEPGAPGLGLVLVRRLVELMGGRLDAQSQPGRGSSFEIQLALPIDPQGRVPDPVPPQRLLLANARADSREATLALLCHLGLAAGLTASADVAGTLAAVAEARQAGRAFDWLLLDWLLPGPGASGAELLAQLRREHPALRIAVLVPPGLDEGPAQARAFGARAVCRTPLLPSDLRRLLRDAPAERPASADAQALDGLRVLLVEDHPINQEIALRLLASRGAVVDVAGNGEEGLARLQAGGPAAYDLVLMDLQMPVLDGLAATRRLRELPGFEQLPVLAMTAHALPEEKALCLAAGMQGHIAKPLDVGLLVRELQRYRPPPAPEPPRPVLDLQLGLRQFGGQAALYRRTLQGFADQYADALAAWPGWLAAGDWAELRRAAHTLQGLAATLGARPLQLAAQALERSAATGDAGGAEPLLARTRAALQAAQGEIQAALDRPWEQAAPAASGPGRLDELRELLAQSDSRALDWWQAHGAHSGLAPELRRRVDEALAALDFDAAAAALGGPPKGGA